MDARTRIAAAFDEAMRDFNGSEAIKFLREGRLRLEHYKSILRQVYYYAREDPQIQALATTRFRGADRNLVSTFLKHATSEVGHDQMALADLKACGADVAQIPFENPLPSTIALTAYAFYQVEYRNPVGYLGYLYFLEHMPTSQGKAYGAAVAGAGVPAEAMTFIGEHIAVDVAHNKLMERYIDQLVRTEEDLQEVAYAVRVTGKLYADMLWEAISHADSGRGCGIDPQERARA